MYHLRLYKSLSYYGMGGALKATRQQPDVYTEDKATADTAVASGYFKFVDNNGNPNTETTTGPTGHLDLEQLEGMTMKELKTLAASRGIDIKGLDKPGLIEAVTAVGAEDGSDNEADFGEDESAGQ